jgi:hypothetical protein
MVVHPLHHLRLLVVVLGLDRGSGLTEELGELGALFGIHLPDPAGDVLGALAERL